MCRKRKEHRRKTEEFLDHIDPDIVISTGMSEKHFLCKINLSSNPAFVRECHFHKYYRRMLAESPYEMLVTRLSESLDYYCSIRKFDRIVLLTEQDREDNWKGWNNVEVIPNPLITIPDIIATLENKIVIAAGRQVRQKNYSSLISAWRIVNASHPDWELRIFGDGPKRPELENQIESMGLTGRIKLLGFSDDIQKEMSEASICVLSTICEGFGLVIIVAMSCGLPVVSYDCPCGSKDIISDGINGFLIHQGNEQQLGDRITNLIDDENLRLRLGAAALETTKMYQPELIAGLWMNLFRSLRPTNR